MQKRRKMKAEVDPYDHLWKSVNAIQADTNHTETVFGQELQQLTNLATYRRQRLLVSDTGLPGILWCVLILGGVTTVAITALFGLDLDQTQVDRGRTFVSGVIERAGTEGLARLWLSPRNLPTPAEGDAPGLWLERISLPELGDGQDD